PDKPGGPETLEERSDDAYRQTFAMNILFLLAFGSLTLTNPELLPEGIAGRDLLLGALPLSVLFVTFRLQMDVISPVRVETRRPDLLRSRCLRLWGSDKTRSSLWYRCAEIVILAPLGLTLIWAIGIGLSSGAAGDDWFNWDWPVERCGRRRLVLYRGEYCSVRDTGSGIALRSRREQNYIEDSSGRNQCD